MLPYTRGERPAVKGPRHKETIMSTIKSFDDALDFYPADHRGSSLSRFAHGLRIYWEALRDGLAAARAYNELMRRGVPHDAAVRQIFNAHFDA
jgi:hypothetical protein